jgi:hypothetical protein
MRDKGSTKIGVHMIWLLVFLLICAINVVAGRAHSRYLDRLEARPDSIQLFLGGSPDCVDQIKSVDHLAAEKDRNSTSLAPGGDRLHDARQRKVAA